MFDESVIYLEDEDFSPEGYLRLDVSKPVIVMVMANYCSFSLEAQPEFQKFARSASHIVPACILTDGSPSQQALGKRLKHIIPGFKGVPMFVAFKNGKFVKEYTGPRKAKDLLKFSKQVWGNS